MRNGQIHSVDSARFCTFVVCSFSFRHELNGGCDDLVDVPFIPGSIGVPLRAESAGDVCSATFINLLQVGIGFRRPGHAAVPAGNIVKY